MGFLTLNGKMAVPRRYFVARLDGVTFESMAYMKSAGVETCETRGRKMIGRLVKFVALIAVLGALALTGYAYLGDLSPDPTEQSLTVTLDAE
jgi:hypothetical protein